MALLRLPDGVQKALQRASFLREVEVWCSRICVHVHASVHGHVHPHASLSMHICIVAGCALGGGEVGEDGGSVVAQGSVAQLGDVREVRVDRDEGVACRLAQRHHLCSKKAVVRRRW